MRVLLSDVPNDTHVDVGIFQSPYRVKEHLHVLKHEDGAVYNCALPFSVISIWYTRTPGVKLSMGSINKIMDERYKYPRSLRTIQVFVGISKDVLSSREFTADSFEETRIAFCFNLEERCQDFLAIDKKLWQWRRFATCCSCKVIITDNAQAFFFKGIELRREVVRFGNQDWPPATQVTHEILRTGKDFASGEKPAAELVSMYADTCCNEDSAEDQDSNLNATKHAIS